MSQTIEQHNREIHSNAEAWKRKPVLRKIYQQFYRNITLFLLKETDGLTVELGSGMGNVKDVIPNCITTDLFPNPWLDRVENAYALTFANESVANLILFDVWHHLQYPGTALREFCRVLRPGGRLVLFEPAMGLLGKLIYGSFHHEPLGLREPIQMDAPAGFDPRNHDYYAAQGNCWRMFRHKASRPELADWTVRETAFFSALAYIGSGGFSGPQMYPAFLLPCIHVLEKLFNCFPSLFATRMLVVMEKGPRRSESDAMQAG